jgi:hypothetical protein
LKKEKLFAYERALKKIGELSIGLPNVVTFVEGDLRKKKQKKE